MPSPPRKTMENGRSLVNADLSGADLTQADLQQADLGGATSGQGADLTRAALGTLHACGDKPFCLPLRLFRVPVGASGSLDWCWE